MAKKQEFQCNDCGHSWQESTDMRPDACEACGSTNVAESKEMQAKPRKKQTSSSRASSSKSRGKSRGW